MDQTVQHLERQVGRSRERLGAHLKELEARVDAATDWREHVRARPAMAAATAFAAGLLLSRTLHGAGPRRHVNQAAAVQLEPRPASMALASRGIDVRGRANHLWEQVGTALIAVAATRLTDYIGAVVPGFTEQLHAVDAKRPFASRPVVVPDGGTS